MGMDQMDRINKLVEKGRELRNFASFEIRAAGDDSGEMIVEGIACVFNRETVMWEYDGVQYKEKVDANAFDGADMSDVIFNYNHGGKVMARTRNKTLELELKPDGLHCRARLDGTEEGRQLFEEIRGGYIDRMSFSWITQEDSYDITTHTRTIRKIKKLYDVSAVDIPAYDTTSISARSVLALDRAEMEKAAADIKRRKRALLLIEI